MTFRLLQTFQDFLTMFKNYLTIAWRNLLRNKLYTIINLTGFSMALAAVFILLVYVSHEFSYDKDIPDYQNTYRIVLAFENSSTPCSGYPMKEQIVRKFPEIKRCTRFMPLHSINYKTKGDFIPLKQTHAVDSSFFSFMGVHLLQGDPQNPIPDSHSIAISEKTAQKLFPEGSPMGKQITIQQKDLQKELTITARYDNMVSNTTYRGEAFIHMDLGVDILVGNMLTYGCEPRREDITENYWFKSVATLLKINPNSNPRLLSEKMQKHFHKLANNQYARNLLLQPIKEAHLKSGDMQNYHTPPGNQKRMLLLLLIACLTLIVASVNYIILSTATSIKRTQEIGIRKVLGANKKELRLQLLTESLLLSIICLPIALTLAELMVPYMGYLFNIHFQIHYSSTMAIIISFSLLTTLAGVLSGMYLSIFMIRLHPIQLLRAKKLTSKKHSFVQKTLILTQIVIFTALLIGSLLMQQQLKQLSVRDLGYNKECLLTIPLRGTSMDGKYSTLKQEIQSIPGVDGISGTMFCPPTTNYMYMTITNPGDPDKKITLNMLQVDKDFISVMGINMIEGNNLASGSGDQQKGIIVNQTGIKEMNLKNPLGTDTSIGPIVGICKDFQISGFKEAMGPICLTKVSKQNMDARIKVIIIRTSPKSLNKVIASIKSIWKEQAPISQLSIQFMDDKLDHLYAKERSFTRMFESFTILAIFIAAMGLFGFSLFIVQQRTQEIGIRKVMGASIIGIILKFSKDYIILLIIAFSIAAPISYYFMQRILENYIYKAPINPWYFVIALAIATAIVMTSIIGNILNAANKNPVESLKYE